MHRSTPLYLLFFLFFIASVARADACASPAALPDVAPNHACCTLADEEGMPAGKDPTWSATLNCHGNICCCTSGEPQAVAAIPTVVSDQLQLRRPPEVLHYVLSLSPAVASAPDKPPLSPFTPLYLRNCAFLI